MNREELLEYIEQSSSSEDSSFQLIHADGKGFYARRDKGAFIAVDYSASDYANLQKVFQNNMDGTTVLKASFMPEFTDDVTGRKVFALYCCVQVMGENGQPEWDTLMSVSNTATYQNYINLDGGFEYFASVLIDHDGNYIIGNNEFKSTNFFQYLYVFNNLNEDQKRLLESEVINQKKGQIYYHNSKGQQCVYVYTEVEGTEWFCVSCVPVESFHGIEEGGIQFSALLVLLLGTLMLIDIGWLVHVNNRLKESVALAQRASSAKTDFLSQMSHDIRTPMNVINGMTNLALMEDLTPEVTDYLKNIQSSSEFLTGLVNDILDLNKVESGKMELHTAPYTYEKFKRNIESIVIPQCQRKGIHFEMICHENKKISLVLDSLRFNQIFLNLLSNAVKFTPEGGMITLEIQSTVQEDHKVLLDFHVKDNGKGMSREFQEHMFDAFSQENAQQTGEVIGTGLGLAIVKNLVTLMHGSIEVESELGKGTIFHIQILAEQSVYEESEQLTAVANREAILKYRTVLLCEDHPLNRQIVMKLLQKKQMHVETAENGQLGVNMMEQSAPGHYAAILMDIRMPIMDGMEAAKRIRACAHPDAKTIPIIAMTANAYDIDVENSIKAGMNAHIAKPIEPEKVYDVLAKYISQ